LRKPRSFGLKGTIALLSFRLANRFNRKKAI
jgi:hypothetical protein